MTTPGGALRHAELRAPPSLIRPTPRPGTQTIAQHPHRLPANHARSTHQGSYLTKPGPMSLRFRGPPLWLQRNKEQGSRTLSIRTSVSRLLFCLSYCPNRTGAAQLQYSVLNLPLIDGLSTRHRSKQHVLAFPKCRISGQLERENGLWITRVIDLNTAIVGVAEETKTMFNERMSFSRLPLSGNTAKPGFHRGPLLHQKSAQERPMAFARGATSVIRPTASKGLA